MTQGFAREELSLDGENAAETQLQNAIVHRRLIRHGPKEAIKHPDGRFVYRHLFTHVEVQPLSGTSIILPADALQACCGISENDLPSPLCFHVLAYHHHKAYCATSLQFSAEPHTVVLSEYLNDLLNYRHPERLLITLVRLPRAEKLTLQLRSEGLEDMIDLKAYIEEALSQYTVVSKGQRLLLQIKERQPLGNAQVVDHLPDDVCGVVIADCDLELELQMESTANARTSYKSRYHQIKLGTLHPIQFSCDRVQCYVPLSQSGLWADRSSNDLRLCLEIISNDPTDDAFDVFVSFPPLQDASFAAFHFCNLAGVSGRPHPHQVDFAITRSSYADTVLSAGASMEIQHPPACVIIGLSRAFDPHKSTTLQVKAYVAQTPEKSVSSPPALENQDKPPTEQCPVCLKEIPEQSLLMHSLHCQRHFRRCFQCGLLLVSDSDTHTHCEVCLAGCEVSELPKHQALVHQPIQCSCDQSIERARFETHRIRECSKRITRCRFCECFVCRGDQPKVSELELYFSLNQHESECGSKSGPCPVCGTPVVLKELSLHLKLIHGAYDPPQICPICHMTLRSAEQAKTHLISHNQRHGSTSTKCFNLNCRLPVVEMSAQLPTFCLRCESRLGLTRPYTLSSVIKALTEAYQTQLTGGCPRNQPSSCSTPSSYCSHGCTTSTQVESL